MIVEFNIHFQKNLKKIQTSNSHIFLPFIHVCPLSNNVFYCNSVFETHYKSHVYLLGLPWIKKKVSNAFCTKTYKFLYTHAFMYVHCRPLCMSRVELEKLSLKFWRTFIFENLWVKCYFLYFYGKFSDKNFQTHAYFTTIDSVKFSFLLIVY